MKALVTRLTTPSPTWPLIVLGVLLLAPTLGLSSTWQRELVLVAALGLVVSGLNLSMGYAGELALGQAAMFAVGAYVTGVLATNGNNDIVLAVVAGGAAALVVGIICGVPGLRLGGWSLAMVSFFLVLVIPDVVRLLPEHTGGLLGLNLPLPSLFGRTLDDTGLYYVALVLCAVWFAAFRNLVASRHGRALDVLRTSPVLATSLGLSVFRTKLQAYALGSIPAGVGGALFAYVDGFIAPESFGFSFAIVVLAASILGGARTVYGALAGAFVLQVMPNRLSVFDGYSLVIYGAFLVVGGLALGPGIAGLARNGVARLRRGLDAGEPARAPRTTTPGAISLPLAPGVVLDVAGVSKAFGGAQVLHDVDFVARPGEVTALIGPNGSGKTTLLNLVSGFYRVDSGRVRVGDEDVTALRPAARARVGLARTFQTPSIPADLDAAEVVATGRYLTHRSSRLAAVLRLPAGRRAERDDREAALAILDGLGVGEVAEQVATSLPLGTRRLIELARAIAADAGVVLLDEVASGLDGHELDRLRDAIVALRDAGATVVLVEHNFDLVMSTADVIHVLAGGEVIASGPPAQIADDPRVHAQYLGSEPDAPAGNDAELQDV